MHGQVRPQGPVLLGTPVAGGSPPGGLPPAPGGGESLEAREQQAT